MGKVSPLTFAGALAILSGRHTAVASALERVAGAGFLLGAVVFPPALGSLGAKTDAGRLLREVLDVGIGRSHSAKGHDRHELLAAAHTTIVCAALFDALRGVIGPGFDQLEMTDEERLQLATGPGEIVAQAAWVEQLAEADVPMPSPVVGFEENLRSRLTPGVAELIGGAVAFFEGLRAWNKFKADGSAIAADALARWHVLYRGMYLRLAAELSEFFVWASVGEHAATRDELRRANARLLETLEQHSAAMGQLHDILAAGGDGGRPRRGSLRTKLARAAGAVLDKPILRSSNLPSGLSFPTVAEGFVTPRFRAAVASPSTTAGLSREDWWADLAVHDDLDAFLAAYLAHPDAAVRPLVVLGHPGAGKSLLAEVLAARLPSGAYAVVPVQLRRVNADDPLFAQLESALSELLHERVSWGQLADEAADVTRVVILDGFDELILATGTVQSSYLTEIVRFQERERALGRSVAVLVTSRTIVVDRARVPDGSLLIKLEEFSDGQIRQWTAAWNRANARNPHFRTLTVEDTHQLGSLARQPLLLTMLGVYHADPRAVGLTDRGLSTTTLYATLLDSFIHRQVVDKPDRPPTEADLPRLLGDLRWRLSIAAFGMFNRGRQHLSEQDLDRDLEAFLGRRAQSDAGRFQSTIGGARQTLAGFFFIHVARVDEHTEHARRMYEFLHATLGEFLVAERALAVIEGYAARHATHLADPASQEAPDDDLVRALLSYRPLAVRVPVVEFVAGLVDRLEPRRREELFDAVRHLLAGARTRSEHRYQRYEPSTPDTVRAAAAYTANLTVLAALLAPGAVPLQQLCPTDAVAGWWRSTYFLWRAGLDHETWHQLAATLMLVDDHGRPAMSLADLNDVDDLDGRSVTARAFGSAPAARFTPAATVVPDAPARTRRRRGAAADRSAPR
jgi:hypothetical protein